MKTTLGGDRLGAGNKQEVSMKNFGRSTHDLGYIWRSTMSAGTLVPFMSEVGLPGDTFDIDLNCDVKTLPTIGPLFGSYKVQLDVFECPIRLYQGKLHMNMLNIGLDMSKVKLPQMKLVGKWVEGEHGDNTQVNPSSIYSYLNMRGLGRCANDEFEAETGDIEREFNAVPYLAYWDIYKNYYSNKQEEEGVVIHAEGFENQFELGTFRISAKLNNNAGWQTITEHDSASNFNASGGVVECEQLCVYSGDGNMYGKPNVKEILFNIGQDQYSMDELFQRIEYVYLQDGTGGVYNDRIQVVGREWIGPLASIPIEVTTKINDDNLSVSNTEPAGYGEPKLTRFPLTNIDDMREDILKAVSNTSSLKIDSRTRAPYGLGLDTVNGVATRDYENAFAKSSQEGLGIKTYQSDLFNNWISTEWIDGDNGINAITSVDTTGDSFTIDSLNLANKVYTMLNRIAISGGSYDDWLDAVYTHERAKAIENPVYHGSLIKELSFEEVISQSDVEVQGNQQPLGTLAGRGALTGKHKGGKIKIKISEPSYVIALCSITPRLDYSQGNKWDVNLKTLNDLHKPSLDAIGFQDLYTDQLCWADTLVNGSDGEIRYSSIGKQPAWINYMTNVNQTRGNFAVGTQGQVGQMFMTLNRRYNIADEGVTDLTTYIDPSKFNHIFADTSSDSQNFWVQIGVQNKARRKMSAKVIPNL